MDSTIPPPTDEENVKIIEKEDHSLVGSLKKPLNKELSRLKVSYRVFSLLLLSLSILLSCIWAIISVSNGNSLPTNLNIVKGTNRFDIDSFGEIKSRLNSKSDVSIYTFLSMHHDTEVLHGGKNNIVTEVLLALEHESVEVGVPLLITLFSELYSVWPVLNIGTVEVLSIRDMINTLKIASTNNDIEKTKEEIEKIRKQLSKLKSFSELKNLDEEKYKSYVENDSPNELITFLKSAIYINECYDYLRKIDEVRQKVFHGEILPHMTSKEQHQMKQNKKLKHETNAPTIKSVPTEKELLQATKVLEELELFVADKPELNVILRSMLLDDLKD